MLIAHSRPLLILQDSFCRPPAHTTHHHLPISLLEIWTVVMASSFQIDKFLHIWQSSWRILELNRRIILSLQDEMICYSVLISCPDSLIFGLLICTPLPLFHSPRHNTRRRSLFMRVLSYSDTHNLNGYIAGCGCHKILIPCSTTALFSTTFLLISIPLLWNERWGWVHIGRIESMLRTENVSDGTSSIRHQVSSDFSTEDRSNT